MIRQDEIVHRHAQMLEYQETIKPFAPTIAELQSVWKMERTSVHYALQRLVYMKLCIVRVVGKKNKIRHYYAVVKQ